MKNPNLPQTFCILPFRHMQIRNSGKVSLCCHSPGLKNGEGKEFNVYEKSVSSIWNSEEMRQVRQDMIEGRRVKECAACWQQEELGGKSRRMDENMWWSESDTKWRVEKLWKRALKYLGKTTSDSCLENIAAAAVSNEFIVNTDPTDLEIEVGNICNLQCRMCSPVYSSKIESDPVHSQWYADVSLAGLRGARQLKAGITYQSRLPENKHWFKEKALVYEELLKNPKSIQHVSFKGGEPLVSKEALGVVDYLASKGNVKNLRFSITTNATVYETAMFKQLSKLKHVNLAVSLDGIDKKYEYIRYPANWESIKRNLENISRHKNILLLTSITFQIYNALDIVELFRFCDKYDYRINFSILHYPSYLAASVMPPKARQVAAQRILDYVESDCKKNNQSNISTLASVLEDVDDGVDRENLQKFMLFTNDLDRSRKQSFREVHGELLGFIEDAGIHWQNDTRFFGRSSD